MAVIRLEMALLLEFYAVLLGFLVLFGGGVFHASFGKFEVGSVDPWAWLFIALLLVARRWDRKSFDSFSMRALSRFQAVSKPGKGKRALSYLLAFVFGTVFLAHLFRHWSFQTDLFDMGFVNQALFHPFSHGTLLQSTLSPDRSYLVDHFSPTLLLLAPITSWAHSNILVFAIQAALLASGTYVLVTRGPLAGRPELFLGAGFILVASRSLRNAGIWDFREDVIAFFLLSLALVSLNRGRIALFLGLLAGYCLTKEHLALVSLGLAIPILWDPKLPLSRKTRTSLALGMTAALVAWSAFFFGYLTPRLMRGIEGASNIVVRFPQFGKTPKEIILNVLTSPHAWWILLRSTVLNSHAWKYAILLLAPYLFFARKAWPWILAAAVGVAINLVGPETQRSLNFHYDVAFLPFLAFAFLRGMELSNAELKKRPALLLVACLAAFSFSGRWPMFSAFQTLPTLKQVKDSQFLENVKCKGIVAANGNIISKLTHCPELRTVLLPSGCTNAYRSFTASNLSDTSRIPGQSAINATEFVLDRLSTCEASLGTALRARGYGLEGLSPSGRYVYLVRYPRHEPLSGTH